MNIGQKKWVIAEGYIPGQSHGPEPEMVSHETACIVNLGEKQANVVMTLFFSDKDPVGPYRVTVPAKRTRHLRFNDLAEPVPVPRDTDFSVYFESDEPVVVQHTRLDSRQAENALMTTTAYPVSSED